jgi:hypothetical protein
MEQAKEADKVRAQRADANAAFVLAGNQPPADSNQSSSDYPSPEKNSDDEDES